MFDVLVMVITSVIREKGESQNRGNLKTKHPKFSEKQKCAYQGVRNICFLENLACFVFRLSHFEILTFALLPTITVISLTIGFCLQTYLRNLFGFKDLLLRHNFPNSLARPSQILLLVLLIILCQKLPL